MPFCCANFKTFAEGSSSSEIPIIRKRPLNSFSSSSNSGISSRQGGHQVAQKFTSTTFPSQSALETGFPKISCALSAGASSGFLTKRITEDGELLEGDAAFTVAGTGRLLAL